MAILDKLLNTEKLDKCIKDISKINEAQKLLEEITYNINSNNLNNYLSYVIKNKVVCTLGEVFYIVTKIPEISEAMEKVISIHGLNGVNKVTETILQDREPSYPSGNYNSLSDVPGYGTDWNERCVPKGVSINNRRNERC